MTQGPWPRLSRLAGRPRFKASSGEATVAADQQRRKRVHLPAGVLVDARARDGEESCDIVGGQQRGVERDGRLVGVRCAGHVLYGAVGPVVRQAVCRPPAGTCDRLLIYLGRQRSERGPGDAPSTPGRATPLWRPLTEPCASQLSGDKGIRRQLYS